jgi:hypothetical protein
MRVRTWGAILSIAVISAVGCGKQEPATRGDASAQSGASAQAPSAQSATWEVEGTMGDACQCAVFCPCEFGSRPTQDNCDDAGILSITKGHYGNVDLSGQKVVVVSASPSGERLVDAVGKLTFATDEQVDALAQIVRNVFGTFVGKTPRISPDEKVVRTDMTITVDSTRYAATIPGVLDVEMKPVIGGDGRTPIVVHNNAFTSMGFGDVAVWQSQKYTYSAEGRKWNYAGRSASVRSFSLKG